MCDKICLKFPKSSQVNAEEIFIVLLTFEDAQTLYWLGNYLYKSFREYPHALRSNLQDHVQPWMPTWICLFLMATQPCVAMFMLSAAALCTILRQMHQQNPANAPTEFRGVFPLGNDITVTPCLKCIQYRHFDFGSKVCVFIVPFNYTSFYLIRLWDIA